MQRITELDDPQRCTAASLDGQCRNRSEHGSDRCRAHGGKSTQAAEDRRLYLLTRAQDRETLDRLSQHDDVKLLTDEIRIVRMLIQDVLNWATSDTERLSTLGQLNQLFLTLDRLQKTSQTLAVSLNEHLAKPTLLALAHSLAAIIHEELADVDDNETIVDRICGRLIATIAAVANTKA